MSIRLGSKASICDCRDAMAVFAMEAASVISERSLEISFASALSTVSASGLNIYAGNMFIHTKFSLMTLVRWFCTMLLSFVSTELHAKLQGDLIEATWNIAKAQSGFLFASLPNHIIYCRSVTDKSVPWQCDMQPSLLLESETPCLSAANKCMLHAFLQQQCLHSCAQGTFALAALLAKGAFPLDCE